MGRASAIAIALVLLVLPACGKPSAEGPKRAFRVPVLVAAAGDQPIRQEVRAGGSLDADETVQIATRVAGVVERVAFHEGMAAEPGQVLIEIEPERFAIALRRAEAAHAKAEAQVAEARSSLARRAGLAQRSDGMVADEELNTWRSRLAQSEADAALAAADLEQARLDARDAAVKAVLAGTIESRSVRLGQFLPVGTVVATQVRRLPLRLRARVTDAEAALLRAGQEVAVVAGGQRLAGVLTLVGQAADPASRTVPVVAEIAQAGPAVVAGAFAELIAQAGDGSPRLAVPASALRASERGWTAFVVEGGDEDAVVRRRTVETGMRGTDGAVEVRSGIAAGERVVVRGIDALRDGQAVAIAAEP